MGNLKPSYLSDSNLLVPQSVINHVNNGKLIVENQSSLVCIDRRTTKEQTKKGGFTPGGTLGTFASALSAFESINFHNEGIINDITDDFRETVLKILIEQVGGKDNICYHTDSNNCTCGGVGCGHLRLILSGESNYQLSAESKIFIENVRNSVEKSVNTILLEGDHKEQHILKVRGIDNSIIPNIGDIQGFVSTPDLVCKFKSELSHKLIPIIPNYFDNLQNISPSFLLEEMMNANTRHLNETLNTLAGHLNIYEVEYVENGEPLIKNLGKVGDEKIIL